MQALTKVSQERIELEKVDELEQLRPLSRAAAISHLIYSETIARPEVDWTTDLEHDWCDLRENARTFNEQLVETWAANPEIFEEWVQAIRSLSKQSDVG